MPIITLTVVNYINEYVVVRASTEPELIHALNWAGGHEVAPGVTDLRVYKKNEIAHCQIGDGEWVDLELSSGATEIRKAAAERGFRTGV